MPSLNNINYPSPSCQLYKKMYFYVSLNKYEKQCQELAVLQHLCFTKAIHIFHTLSWSGFRSPAQKFVCSYKSESFTLSKSTAP